MERISAVICTYNEEDNIEACIDSVYGVDEVVVADDGSTDKTVELAKACGARVHRRKDWSERASQVVVNEFVERFGWQPSFEDGTRIRNGHLEAREAQSFARNDWIVVPDADERVTWDLKKVRRLLPLSDQIVCDFVHSHKPNGEPETTFTITKMFRRSLSTIDARTHTVVLPNGRIVSTHDMRIDHWPKTLHKQTYVLPILEYSVAKEDDLRSRFYLGREYYNQDQCEHAITLFNHYLKDAKWMPEIGHARLYMAYCFWKLKQGDSARKNAIQAFLINPDHKQAIEFLANTCTEPWRSKWQHIAENATNKDVLFIV